MDTQTYEKIVRMRSESMTTNNFLVLAKSYGTVQYPVPSLVRQGKSFAGIHASGYVQVPHSELAMHLGIADWFVLAHATDTRRRNVIVLVTDGYGLCYTTGLLNELLPVEYTNVTV